MSEHWVTHLDIGPYSITASRLLQLENTIFITSMQKV